MLILPTGKNGGYQFLDTCLRDLRDILFYVGDTRITGIIKCGDLITVPHAAGGQKGADMPCNLLIDTEQSVCFGMIVQILEQELFFPSRRGDVKINEKNAVGWNRKTFFREGVTIACQPVRGDRIMASRREKRRVKTALVNKILYRLPCDLIVISINAA